MKLHEWKDSSGKTIKINTPASSTSTNFSIGYKKRFEKLIKYHIDHASSELESITTKDIKPYAFHLGEHHNNGYKEFDKDFIVNVDKDSEIFSVSIFIDGKEINEFKSKGYNNFVIGIEPFMWLPNRGDPDRINLLVEWVDTKGNKVNLNNSSTSQTPGTSSKSNKEKFEELTQYMKNNRGTISIKSEIIRVDDHGFTYKEHWDSNISAIGSAYTLTLLVGYSRFNSAWSFELYMDQALIKQLQGSGMQDLIAELGNYFRVPKAGSVEYKSLTESRAIAEDFKEYESLWD